MAQNLFLHFNDSNDLVWTNSSEKRRKMEPIPASVLDIYVKNGDVLNIALGDSMVNWKFWNNPNPKYNWGQNEPISIDKAMIRGSSSTPQRESGNGEFEISKKTSRGFTLEHIISKVGSIFKFDLHVSYNIGGKETFIIIDPIINNNGAGPPN